MSAAKSKQTENDEYFDCSFVSIHYIICECGETFPTENALRVHLEKEHPHKRERKEFKCGVCGFIYNTEEECIVHYESTHLEADLKQDEYSDEDKPDLFIKDDTADDEIDEAGEDKTDIACEETDGNELANVTTDGIKVSSDSNEIVVQDESGQLLHIPQDKVQVIQQPDGQFVLMVTDHTPASIKKKQRKKRTATIVCEICGKSYASNAALRYHQRVHTGEKPYRCHICPKRFTMPLFLQIHVRTHTGERPYQCSECPKAFSNKAALLRHERVHTGVKPYQCPMCYKCFTQSNSMKLHVSTVHLKQPAPYKSKTRKQRALERLRLKGMSKMYSEEVANTIKLEDNDEDLSEESYEVVEEMPGEGNEHLEIIYEG